MTDNICVATYLAIYLSVFLPFLLLIHPHTHPRIHPHIHPFFVKLLNFKKTHKYTAWPCHEGPPEPARSLDKAGRNATGGFTDCGAGPKTPRVDGRLTDNIPNLDLNGNGSTPIINYPTSIIHFT